MKSNLPLYIAAAALGALSLTAGVSMAQQQRPPRPDFAGAAATLDVPEDALMSCLGPHPEPGQRPPRPDALKIAGCLGNAGHAVSEKAVNAALAAAGPKRPG